MSIYKHTHTHTHMSQISCQIIPNSSTRLCIYSYMFVCIYVHTCTSVRMYMYARMYIGTYVRTCVCTYARFMFVRICVQISCGICVQISCACCMSHETKWHETCLISHAPSDILAASIGDIASYVYLHVCTYGHLQKSVGVWPLCVSVLGPFPVDACIITDIVCIITDNVFRKVPTKKPYIKYKQW